MIQNIETIIAKLRAEKLPIIFQTASLEKEYMTRVTTFIDDKICSFNKKIGKYGPVYCFVEYIPPKEKGTGTRVITNLNLDDFLIEADFDIFKNKFSGLADHILNNDEIKKYSSIQAYIKTRTLNVFPIIPGKRVTHKLWKDSMKPYSALMIDQIGWEVDDEIIDHFIEDVPPKSGLYWCASGEPYDIVTEVINGEKIESSRYISFHMYDNVYYNAGLKTINELKRWDEFVKKLIRNLDKLDGNKNFTERLS